MSDITPTRATIKFWQWAPVATVLVCATLVLGAVVLLVGWQIGGWFQNATVNRDARIQEHSFSYQQAAIEQTSQDITNARLSSGGAAAAWAGEACQAAIKIDTVPASMLSWVNTNCSAGSLSPSSSYFQGGN